VKKCASCTKDLPEAALHCVFCGAKQPPAPAVQQGMAKTAFGYSANEVMDQLNRPRSGSQNPPMQQPPQQPPALQPTMVQSGYPQPGYPQAGLAQPNAANAATMFAPGPPPQQQGYQQPYPPMGSGGMPPQVKTAPAHAATQAAGTAPSAGMGIHSPQQLTPQALPTAPPPYLASQTAARAGHPIEPWKDPLRIVMFVWGALTLAAFVTPLSIDPVTFNWDAIIHASGTDKLPALILAAVGLLSVVIAGIPMPVLPRGLLAAVLGLAGIFVPQLIKGMPHWQELLGLVAILALVPGLLVRNEYTESLFARILVTLGVICLLLPLLLPDHGEVPLVAMFKNLLDAPGKAKIGPALELGLIVIAVMSLLAWMPGPATGGAKGFAWLLILWPTLISQVALLLVQGHLGDVIKESPFRATMAWAPAAAYMALVGYGLATVFGKQLE